MGRRAGAALARLGDAALDRARRAASTRRPRRRRRDNGRGVRDDEHVRVAAPLRRARRGGRAAGAALRQSRRRRRARPCRARGGGDRVARRRALDGLAKFEPPTRTSAARPRRAAAVVRVCHASGWRETGCNRPTCRPSPSGPRAPRSTVRWARWRDGARTPSPSGSTPRGRGGAAARGRPRRARRPRARRRVELGDDAGLGAGRRRRGGGRAVAGARSSSALEARGGFDKNFSVAPAAPAARWRSR